MKQESLYALTSIENGAVTGSWDMLWDDGMDFVPKPVCYCDTCREAIYSGDTYWTDGEEIVCAACAEKMTKEEIERYGEETA